MKNMKLGIGLLILFGTLIFSSGLTTVLAFDDDSDGVDDDFEDSTMRNLNVETEAGKIKVESILRTGDIKNKVEFEIRNESSGLSFQISFASHYDDMVNESEIELEFEVIFKEIVEYIDNDANGIYNDSLDTEVQVYELNSFKTTQHMITPISPDTNLHYFLLSTTDNVFKAHVFFVEEFEIVNNTLITPSETKIDIEINNFNNLSDSSRLALLTKLKSEVDYEEKEETEDEAFGYSNDENGVYTLNNTNVGFFSWKENALVDDVLVTVLKNPIEPDEFEPNEQNLYLNYPQGTVIYHDPKIGIEGLYSTATAPGLISGYGIATVLVGTLFGIGVVVFLYKRRKGN